MAENICHAAVKQIEKQPVRSAKHTLTYTQNLTHLLGAGLRKASKTT